MDKVLSPPFLALSCDTVSSVNLMFTIGSTVLNGYASAMVMLVSNVMLVTFDLARKKSMFVKYWWVCQKYLHLNKVEFTKCEHVGSVLQQSFSILQKQLVPTGGCHTSLLLRIDMFSLFSHPSSMCCVPMTLWGMVSREFP